MKITIWAHLPFGDVLFLFLKFSFRL